MNVLRQPVDITYSRCKNERRQSILSCHPVAHPEILHRYDQILGSVHGLRDKKPAVRPKDDATETEEKVAQPEICFTVTQLF